MHSESNHQGSEGRLDTSLLPLFPLADEVCFPHTELRLQVIDEEYQDLVAELFSQVGTEGRLGTVLLRPDQTSALSRAEMLGTAMVDSATAPSTSVFSSGTVARLLDYSVNDEGCDVLLRGEYRFEVERELGKGPLLEAMIRPLVEPRLDVVTPEIRELQQGLLDCTSNLAWELGSRFPLDEELMSDLHCEAPFEQVVNQLAAHLDIPPLRKQQLLQSSLADRAGHLLDILKNRCQVLDILRPFRHLAQASGLN